MNDFTPSQFPDRRASDGLSIHLERLHGDVSDMRESLKELAAAVSRLALVEERLGNTNQALERVFKVIEKLEARMVSVEAQAITSTSTSKWVDQAIYACLAALATYAATHIGILK